MHEQLIKMYDYHIWANGRILEHLQSLPSEIFTQQVDLGFKSIAEVVTHIITVDEIWISKIKGESALPSAPKTFHDIKEAKEYVSKAHEQVRDYLLTIDDTERKVSFKLGSGQALQNSISEIVQQVVNHGTYHRGNITTMLRHLGQIGVMTDYIAYLMKKS